MCFSSVQFQAKFCVHQSPPTQYCARLLRYPLATTTTTNDYYAHFTGVIFRLYFFFPYDRMIIIIIFFLVFLTFLCCLDKTDYLPPAALPYFAPFSIHRGIFVGKKQFSSRGGFFSLSLYVYSTPSHKLYIYYIFIYFRFTQVVTFLRLCLF